MDVFRYYFMCSFFTYVSLYSRGTFFYCTIGVLPLLFILKEITLHLMGIKPTIISAECLDTFETHVHLASENRFKIQIRISSVFCGLYYSVIGNCIGTNPWQKCAKQRQFMLCNIVVRNKLTVRGLLPYFVF